MDDIKEQIERLRSRNSSGEDVQKAADTMERLLAENELLREELIEHQDSDDALWAVLKAADALLHIDNLMTNELLCFRQVVGEAMTTEQWVQGKTIELVDDAEGRN